MIGNITNDISKFVCDHKDLRIQNLSSKINQRFWTSGFVIHHLS
jgi:hypothetical protein